MYDAADLDPKPAAERAAVAREMTQLGVRLTRKLVEDVEAETCKVADPALAFSRLSRAVRLTLALEEKFEQGPVKAQAPQTNFSRLRGFILKDEAAHRVREMIDLEAEEGGEGFEAERLLRELDERLDDPEDLEDFALLPLHETVRRLCNDLGVPFDEDLWQDLACEDVANFPGNYEPLPTAHPGEGRDPDERAPDQPRPHPSPSGPSEPYDLDPGLRRDEREGVGPGELNLILDLSPSPT
jgi:hypothetical protein